MVEIDGTPRERLGETVTSPYPEDDLEAEWDALLTALAVEFQDVEDTLDEVMRQKFPQTATGARLDKHGRKFQTPRETGESDIAYRSRIRMALPSYLSGATTDDILELTAALLDTDDTNLTLVEDADSPAFELYISIADYSSLDVSRDEWVDLLNTVTAAGVRGEPYATADIATIRVQAGAVTAETLGDMGLSSPNLNHLSTDGWYQGFSETNTLDALSITLSPQPVQATTIGPSPAEITISPQSVVATTYDKVLSSANLGSLSSGEWQLSSGT